MPLYEGQDGAGFTTIALLRSRSNQSSRTSTARLSRSLLPRNRHSDPNWLPRAPLLAVAEAECGWPSSFDWILGFKEITAPTNARTFIAALLPTVAFGNKVPILRA